MYHEVIVSAYSLYLSPAERPAVLPPPSPIFFVIPLEHDFDVFLSDDDDDDGIQIKSIKSLPTPRYEYIYPQYTCTLDIIIYHSP